MAEPMIVNIPNADDVYINGLPILVANKVYSLPSINVPDTFELVIMASPLNAGVILLSRQAQPTNFNSIPLLAGMSWRYKITNASIFTVLGTTVGDVVLLTCEQVSESSQLERFVARKRG